MFKRTLKILVILTVLVVSFAPLTVEAQSPCGDSVTVVRGDTLTEIAARCNTTVEAIMELNNLNSTVIEVGEVLRIPPEAPQQKPPVVAIAPLSGPPGTEIEIIANGFPAGQTVNIGLGEVNAEYSILQQAAADIYGAIVTQLTIPLTIDETDNRLVVVVETEDRTLRAISHVFTAQVPGAEPTERPEEALFDTTDIYLVALGDAGQSGDEIGCNDSVVPVEISIEPTIAPMTAAYENLFAIDTRYYGPTNLYNALYRSDLSVEGINIEDGLATVNLAGTLRVAGACDAPRIRAQLRYTAIQYYTVDEVVIYVNGIPLDDMLSGQ